MRLINTTTLSVNVFSNDDEVRYAILSHRWEEEEISLQDLDLPNLSVMKSYAKFKEACSEARKDGLQWIWIDTCCIDKTSSAELSEAIKLDVQMSANDFETSAWFTRGWTLQELVAPRKLKFYNKYWQTFGSKKGMQERLATITRIPLSVLRGESPTVCSIAQRMSWAANRVTTHPEDKAYCLMGLFGVNMPMLYGEGIRAFIRLQEEIIKSSDDHSIFAWSIDHGGSRGILAPSPSCFRNCTNIASTAPTSDPEQYSITNVGLSIRLQVMPWAMNTYLAVLQCRDKSHEYELMPNARWQAQHIHIGIFIRRTARDKQYVRVALSGDDLTQVDTLVYGNRLVPIPLLILQHTDPAADTKYLYGFLLRNMTCFLFHNPLNDEGDPYRIHTRAPMTESIWSDGSYQIVNNWFLKNDLNYKVASSDRIVKLFQLNHGQHGLVMSFVTTSNTPQALREEALGFEEVAAMSFGFDHDFRPVCIIYNFQTKASADSLDDFGNFVALAEEASVLDIWGERDSISEKWSKNGYCVLVGHRESGLSLSLNQLNLRIEVHKGWSNAATQAWIVDVGVIRGNIAHMEPYVSTTRQDMRPEQMELPQL